MIFILIAGSYTPICLITLKGRTGVILLSLVWGIALVGIYPESILGILSEMGILHSLHWNGLDLCPRFHPDFKCSLTGSVWLASGRRYHLHDRRHHLCIEAPNLQ